MLKNMFLFLPLILVFVSCDEDYPKVVEGITVNNTTERFIEISGESIVLNDSDGIYEVYPYEVFYFEIDRNNYDLWLTESQFEELVSHLKIYSVDSGVTTYVNSSYYNKIGLWVNNYYQDEWGGNYPYKNEHRIEITEEMFN